MNENEKILHYQNKRDEYSFPTTQHQPNSPFLNPINENVVQNETFSYLSDGRGNYLKIYYDPIRAPNYEQNNSAFVDYLPANNNPNQNRSQFPTSLFQQQQDTQQSSPVHQPQAQQSINPLINQLITQWTPTVSGDGTYKPFGEPTGFPTSTGSFQTQQQPTAAPFKESRPLNIGDFSDGSNNIQKEPLQNLTKSSEDTSASIKSSNITINNTNHPVGNVANNQTRKRIVAAVKPMRMSYSDVLSKNVINNNNSTENANQQNGNGTNNTSAVNQQSKNIKPDKNKYQNSFEKKTSSPVNGNENDKENNQNAQKAKKSSAQGFNASGNPTVWNSEKNGSSKKNSSGLGNSTGKTDINNGKNLSNQDKAAGKKKLNQKMKMKNSGSQGNASNSYDENLKKRRDKDYNEDLDLDYDDLEYEEYDNYSDSDFEEDSKGNYSEYYNVRKNNSDNTQHHNIEKIRQNQNSMRKMKTSSSQLSSRAQQVKQDKSQRRMGKSFVNSKKRQKHEILLKIFESSWNYLLKFVAWLWSLIVDVVYLSFGIMYDRVYMGFQSIKQFCVNLRSDLRANSGRPGLWLKNLWKKFDGKFEKKSKWAFWRYLFKKKEKQPEQVKDYYKEGKLPTTADEAMKSLLNCKGKDAYSILGVSPNCSQEQIRKHYKKIAVLVHPDKNKQAGAEEAFKVLQRSFELIGEPESRKAYDLSLAEHLNAEKAWSELNDLLVQLQTKISEAANTIRCSSCCLRHPRKPTGRKPFAARECSACKIRHPAREGDIWAETTFFGIRWKYLALMEGNVYDITEWANCQKNQLSHLAANSCVVQYKIVLGGNQQNQTQSSQFEREKYKKEPTATEPSFDDFLNNIYAGQTQNQHHANSRRRYKKN